MKKLLLIYFYLVFIDVAAGQEIRPVDFTHLKAEISVFPAEGMVSGDLIYSFDVLQKTDSVSIDARKMDFQEVSLNGEKIEFKNDQQQLTIFGNFKISKDNILKLHYSAHPSQAMYFIQTEPEGGE